jgi:hypothetical protein
MILPILADGTSEWVNVGMFVATVLAVIVTIAALIISHCAYRSQVDPEVIVFATLDEDRPTVINLVIKNIGRGVARNIRFTLSRTIPDAAFGFGDAPTPKTMTEGPLFNGIPALVPDEKRVIIWGQYGGLYKGIGDETIQATIEYTSETRFPFRQRKHLTVCPLEIKSFQHTVTPEERWDKHAAEALEKIAKSIQPVLSGR